MDDWTKSNHPLTAIYKYIKGGGYSMSEEITVVDTETSEDTTNEKLFSIKEGTLQTFGSLCRTLTNEPGELFDIGEIKEVLNWVQSEVITQQDLINQIEAVIYQKINNEVNDQ